MAYRNCPRCGGPAEWVAQYGKHFCRRCNQYLPDQAYAAPVAPAPPPVQPVVHVQLGHGLMPGVYRILAGHSSKALDVEGQSHADGAKLIQWTYNGGANQHWRVEPVGGFFRIIASHSGKALDVEGGSVADGAKLIQWTYHGGGNQHWRVEPVAGGLFRILASNSGKALDVEGQSQADGAKILQWAYHGGANQHWRMDRVG